MKILVTFLFLLSFNSFAAKTECLSSDGRYSFEFKEDNILRIEKKVASTSEIGHGLFSGRILELNSYQIHETFAARPNGLKKEDLKSVFGLDDNNKDFWGHLFALKNIEGVTYFAIDWQNPYSMVKDLVLINCK